MRRSHIVVVLVGLAVWLTAPPARAQVTEACEAEKGILQTLQDQLNAVFGAGGTPKATTLGVTTIEEVERIGVFSQENNTCGPTAISTVLLHRGLITVDPKDQTAARRLQYELYDSAYNTAELKKARGGKAIDPDETLGVHPEGMLAILKTRGLVGVWHDADFDPRGIKANAAPVPGGKDYIARRGKAIQGVPDAVQRAELRALRDETDRALSEGKTVLVRFAWGNSPEGYHWNVIHGIDRNNPGHYIVSDPIEGVVRSMEKDRLRSDCEQYERDSQRCLKGIIVVDAGR